MGNKGSPAIANLGLREAAKLIPVGDIGEEASRAGGRSTEQPPWRKPYHEGLEVGKDGDGNIDQVEEFLSQQMYVDDGLGSGESPEEVVRILQGAIHRLGRVGIRLCKICSNSLEVSREFPESEQRKLVDLSPQQGIGSPHVGTHSLGLVWNV